MNLSVFKWIAFSRIHFCSCCWRFMKKYYVDGSRKTGFTAPDLATRITESLKNGLFCRYKMKTLRLINRNRTMKTAELFSKLLILLSSKFRSNRRSWYFMCPWGMMKTVARGLYISSVLKWYKNRKVDDGWLFIDWLWQLIRKFSFTINRTCNVRYIVTMMSWVFT